ncbi:MAG: hypothetical protein Rhob2KO_54730 [Rhodopirellula baltica]
MVEAFAGEATDNPAGRLSVKSSEVAAIALAELLMTKETVEVPPDRMVAGAKDCVKLGVDVPVPCTLNV